ncbi:copper resistance protein B [Sphingomonas profundi]|uniref:copper resistance protein B n=1 Tax=Alterirhizorhabdus profundi TaxID=2681549 RepID=UPI0030CB9E7C
MRLRPLLALALASVASIARAQDHDHHPGMTMPPPAPVEVAPARPIGTDARPGSASAPAPPEDRWNDRYWPAEAMAESRARLAREHGGMILSQAMLNILEVQPRGGRAGYRWDGEGWIGGDLDRLTIKSEGEGRVGRRASEAEVQALYSRAIDAYWNVQAGVRQDLQPGARHTYATLGVEGLAPYWFEVEGALFLSNTGDLLGRIEAYYDQRITQRLVLQPRVELEAAAQDVPEDRIGHGLSEVSLDLRLRYEVRRELAPYVGVSWERWLGRTGDLVAASGEGRGGTRLVMGVRAWF